MKQCLKDIGEKAIRAYSESVREDWVLEWPGQIVLSGSQTHWTAEVSTAISQGTICICLMRVCSDLFCSLLYLSIPCQYFLLLLSCALWSILLQMHILYVHLALYSYDLQIKAL
jgi:hypothetical protein